MDKLSWLGSSVDMIQHNCAVALDLSARVAFMGLLFHEIERKHPEMLERPEDLVIKITFERNLWDIQAKAEIIECS